MKIQLDDKFVISSDSNSFTLSALTTPKEDSDKEPSLKFVGSYGDLGSALIGYIRNESRSRDIDLEVSEIINYFQDLEKRIIATYKGK